jgi:outer membrane protein, heavy metal efflux system
MILRRALPLSMALAALLAPLSALAQGDPPSQPAPAPAAAPPAVPASGLTMDEVVAVTLRRNRDVVAAKMDIEAAQLDKVAASVYPNPIFSYTLGNIVLGTANGQGQTPAVSAGPLSQTVHAIGVSEIVDVWNKRGARMDAADRGVELRRLQVEDVLREIVHAVRSAAADVLREQSENELAREVAGHYEETVRLSRARQKAGEISEAELKKIELEGLRYSTAVIDADMDLDIARERLASLMGLPPAEAGKLKVADPGDARAPLPLATLTQRALEQRPDLQAARKGHAFADSSLTQAKREAYPDISLGLTYTHSEFTVSGDNPNSLALTLSLPLPIFDRNQAAIGRANLAMRRADNEAARLELSVAHEVADAVRRDTRARALLDAYEGGMLERAESSLRVAEKSYKAGAVSLLELLEAQRTYLEIKDDYLKTLNTFQQARVDVAHAVGGATN